MPPLPKFFRVSRLPYEEDAHQYIVSVSDGYQGASTEFYVHDKRIKVLAEQLKVFPRCPMDEVRFEYGAREDTRISGYVYMRFYLRDAAGHGALRVHFITRGDDLGTSEINFAFDLEVAAINRIGAAVMTLLQTDQDELAIEL